MTNIQAKSIIKAFDRIKRSQKERELALLNERAYRGISTNNTSWISADVHGDFVYRGVPYTK